MKDLSVNLGSMEVLKDINFSISNQEIVGIIGPNGSGKSTLFKVITGLLKAKEGIVTLDGVNIHSDFNLVANKIGFLIEEPVLYNYLTGEENLKICLRLHGINDFTYLNKVSSYLNLEKILNKKVSKYSMGMRQRLGIACAIVHNPDLLILDEPTNCLDIEGINELRSFLNFLKNDGKSIIISSHMINEIEEICDRGLIIRSGKIIDSFDKNVYSDIENINYIVSVAYDNENKSWFREYKHDISENNVIFSVKNTELNLLLERLMNDNIEVLDIKKSKNNLENYFLKRVGKYD